MKVVSDDCSNVTEDKETVFKKMATARSIIVQALGDKPLRTVMAEKTNPFVMWRKLCERYATATATTRVQLQTRLHQMNYSSAKSMSEYIDEMEGIFNRLESMECPVQESMKVAILLASFGNKPTSSYGPVISALETLSDDKLTWDSTTSRMLQEYDSKQSHSAELTRSEGSKRFVSALKVKANVVCYSCGKKGHFARDCYGKKDREDEKPFNYAKVCTKPKVQFAMAGIDGAYVKTIIHSGDSSHMVGSKALLKAPFTSVKQRVVLGDGRSVFSETTGCAVISCSSVRDRPRSFVRKDVLLVPTLDTNLLSCAEMDKNRHEVIFGSGECQLKPAGEQESIVIGKLRSGVYELTGKLGIHEESRAARVHRDPTSDVVWHNRMGHVGMSTVHAMMKHRSVKGLRLDESEDKSSRCEWFLDGKQTRSSLKKRIQKATEAGEIIHSDVCGPMPVASISHKRYFVTFIDA